MTRQSFSLYRRLAFASLAVASISSLTACSKPAPPPAENAQQVPSSPPTAPAPAPAPPAAALLTDLPAQFRSWPRQAAPLTACGFDSIRKGANGNLEITGWGVIEAAAGVVPESFILKLDKAGSVSYVTTEAAERQDIAQKLGNPALVRSGFKVTLNSKVIQPPFTGTLIIDFDQRLFTCEYKLQA